MYKKLSLSACLYACLCFILFLCYRLELPVFKSFFSDSDALYLPILFKNILAQHGSIKDWYLTPAPYFFPDFLIFLQAYVLGATIPAQMVYCAWFQITLLAVICYFIFKNTFHMLKCTAISSALFCAILLFALALQCTLEPTPFSYLLVSSFHYGAFLTELVCLALMVLFITNPHDSRPVIALSLLSFVIAASDAIFIVQYVLPMMLSLLFTRTYRMQLLLPIGFSAIGFLIYPALVAHPTRYPNRPGWGSIVSNFHEIEAIFHHFFQTIPQAVIFLFIFYVMLACVLLVIVIKQLNISKTVNHFSGLIFLSFFTFLSMMTSIAAMLFITHFIPTSRYFISIVSLPIIVTVGFIGMMLKKRVYLLMMSGGVVILALLSFQVIDLYRTGRAHSTGYYSQDIACIDQSLAKYPSLQHGIGQYWDAKLIQAFSRRDLIMAQHEKKLQERRWITSDSFFQPMYDFAVVNMKAKHPDFTLSLDKIAQYNNPPLERIQCGKYIVLIYQKNTLKTRRIISAFY